jgi:hypothetical protein
MEERRITLWRVGQSPLIPRQVLDDVSDRIEGELLSVLGEAALASKGLSLV